MAEEPEKVLPQYRRAAFVIDQFVADDETTGNEEARAAHAIEHQQHTGCEQHRESEQS